jgi:hypothetical protein
MIGDFWSAVKYSDFQCSGRGPTIARSSPGMAGAAFCWRKDFRRPSLGLNDGKRQHPAGFFEFPRICPVRL